MGGFFMERKRKKVNRILFNDKLPEGYFRVIFYGKPALLPKKDGELYRGSEYTPKQLEAVFLLRDRERYMRVFGERGRMKEIRMTPLSMQRIRMERNVLRTHLGIPLPENMEDYYKRKKERR